MGAFVLGINPSILLELGGLVGVLIMNTGTTVLKLFTIYAPPAGGPGTLRSTKAEVLATEG